MKRLLVHDYPGHAFPLALSRWMAGRGIVVRHLYSASFESPRGDTARRADDPPGLAIVPVTLDEPFAKYSLRKRRAQEARYARMVAAEIAAFRPDAVLSNGSPVIQARLCAAAHRAGAGFVYWLQDLYAPAMLRFARARLGRFAAWALTPLVEGGEFATLRRADAVVAIEAGWTGLLTRRGVQAARIATIPNWASLTEIVPLQRPTAWAETHGLADAFVFVYAGTLGLKHNPALLAALAERFQGQDEVRVVVATQGLGRTWLDKRRAEAGLERLTLLDFQPHAQLPEMLASADVLLAILEPEAGMMSVPSKVLSYLAAGRPILGAIPAQNAAAATILAAGAGLVTDPSDPAAFAEAAARLHADRAMLPAMGRAARAYAERLFALEPIGAKFLAVLEQASRR